MVGAAEEAAMAEEAEAMAIVSVGLRHLLTIRRIAPSCTANIISTTSKIASGSSAKIKQ